ncbi:16S rRNA (cytosine(1402)-N(4))-methyltransferase RsmH [Candidatus Aerophobetes bacterium]|nr:16S rRNA (cytosine(1402)-N(4))-methyltransferase RsmH [Candidatus Aerophobetes bacterium]
MKFHMHTPVMVQEVLHYIAPRKGGIYVDCTLGTGGHSQAMLEKTDGKIRLIGIDWDEEAINISCKHLREYKEQVVLVRANFADITKILKEENIYKVNGFLYDLGLSSHQLDNVFRGFSFREDALLDMRMDKREKINAADIVNKSSQSELEDILWNLGEERWAKRMAEFIIEERKVCPITSTKQLVEILKRAVPAKFRRGRKIHFATRTFQALRIAVNRELENLQKSLSEAINFLSSGGKICVMSYHSLEDRIVKSKFKQVEGKELRILTPKVVKPSLQETKENPRSRSARLRAAERL